MVFLFRMRSWHAEVFGVLSSEIPCTLPFLFSLVWFVSVTRGEALSAYRLLAWILSMRPSDPEALGQTIGQFQVEEFKLRS